MKPGIIILAVSIASLSVVQRSEAQTALPFTVCQPSDVGSGELLPADMLLPGPSTALTTALVYVGAGQLNTFGEQPIAPNICTPVTEARLIASQVFAHAAPPTACAAGEGLILGDQMIFESVDAIPNASEPLVVISADGDRVGTVVAISAPYFLVNREARGSERVFQAARRRVPLDRLRRREMAAMGMNQFGDPVAFVVGNVMTPDVPAATRDRRYSLSGPFVALRGECAQQ